MSEVYFIRPIGMEGPVKIGRSGNTEKRCAYLMVWSPFPLEIAATIPGGSRLELQFHAKFADDHTHREWFRPSPELSRVIEEIRAGTFDVETLPLPRRVVAPLNGNGWTERTRIAAGLSQQLGWLQRRGVTIPWASFGDRREPMPEEQFNAQCELIREFIRAAKAAA